ncbi:MAG: hypothetical protein QHH75_04330 [Bacillota bacterium]|nr:hypothetical protein [Bacillota bacterium]
MTPENEGGNGYVKREQEETTRKKLQKQEKPETSPEEKEPQVEEKIELEFPYDDLDFFYKYVLKELGIQNPFKKKRKIAF